MVLLLADHPPAASFHDMEARQEQAVESRHQPVGERCSNEAQLSPVGASWATFACCGSMKRGGSALRAFEINGIDRLSGTPAELFSSWGLAAIVDSTWEAGVQWPQKQKCWGDDYAERLPSRAVYTRYARDRGSKPQRSARQSF